ncbi:MAG: amino acid adenylation domain-containing protein, partial [Acidobacteria bacterium]|nr:amino acid adenylation domain-containing protein [Acidobacteriota bacterium]
MKKIFAEFNNTCWEYHQCKSLQPVEVKEYYGLTAAQKRLYQLQQMDKRGTAYNITVRWELGGILDQNRLADVFNTLIQRHESFRTSFEIIADEPIQRIHKKVDFKIDIDAEVQHVQPFDLSHAPLLRVSLVKLEEKKFILQLDMHHIINDAVSQGILLKEFSVLYAGEDLPTLRIQYKDYAEWQNRPGQRELMKRQESYWLQNFSGALPVLELPSDYPKAAIQCLEKVRVGFMLDEQETTRLKEMAREADTSFYIMILSIYNILFFKLSGQHDIIIGIPTMGRRDADLQHIIGMFANTLAVRNYPEPSKIFNEFLIEVRGRTLEAYENQEYPLNDLVAKLSSSGDTGRNPLFNVMFILPNQGKPETWIPGLELKTVELEHTTMGFDFSLCVEEVNHELLFSVNFRKKLFTQATITLIIESFKTILASVIKNSHQALADINVISQERRAAILEQLNQDLEHEAAPIMGGGIFQTHLQQSLLKFPGNIAVEYGRSLVSYAELDRGSSVVCRWILNRGIPGNTFIGMLINHRLQLIVTLLGIIKAGSVIVPLYPGYPTERLEKMIKVTGLRYIFIDEDNVCRFKQDPGIEFIDPSRFDFDPQGEKESGDNKSAVRYNPGDPLYIHFTSGSTGEPKAILGKNRGLLHFISWEIKTLGIDPGFHAAQFTIPGFDPFLRDVFAPLLAGGVVCIPAHEDIVRHAAQLVDYVEQRRISLIHCVTGLFRLMLSGTPPPNYFRNLKYILLAGEKTNPSDLIEWYELFGEHVQLVNCYGPTETTMSKVYYFITPRDINRERIPVGKPLVGSRVIILDENRNLCAPLTPGEICIRTPFGSCGYANGPELNREKFIPNPFSDAPGDIIYRSGDLGRVLADGNIDILGRSDRQVKIRGYRVEPGDIEHHLIKHPEIKDALVLMLVDESKDNYLCAYIIPRRPFTNLELREYLAQKLPDYMIPSYFVQMERFPLNARGKIDRSGFPGPVIEADADFVPPANEMEKKLLKIWSEVLHKEENAISVQANFFALGGHSIKAAALVARIHKEFNVKTPMSKFFEFSSVRAQAQYIKNAVPDKYNAIAPVEKKDYYPMAPAQKRMYILQEVNPGGVNYNMPLFTMLEGLLDKARLENAFKGLIHRHESLRTSFHLVDNRLVQRVQDNVNFVIEYHEGTPKAEIIGNFVRPFDLSQAPFLRVGLIKTGAEEHMLLVDMHHS